MYVITYKDTPTESRIYLTREKYSDQIGFFQGDLNNAWIFPTGTEAAKTMMRRAVAAPGVAIEKYAIRKIKPVQRPQYELAEIA